MASLATSPFIVTEHVIDGQHVREYPDASVNGAALKLVLKRYTPVNNPNPQPGDVTIIGAHGCGFPKELYEPLWEDILARSDQDGYRIRSIWIADVVNLGASSIENEGKLGNDPSWFDHSRDLLHMINQFREEMPQPIVGVGHSMGAGQLMLLSFLHPRLFSSLSLIEPVIAPDIITGKGPLLSIVSLKRRDTWESREAAMKAAQKSHKRWDPRVLDRWMQHGYRDLPADASTPAQNDVSAAKSEGRVTLKSSKYQEVLQYIRPNLSGHKALGENVDQSKPTHDPLFYPDIIGPPETTGVFYRYEPILAWKMLEHVRPPVLYVLGHKGEILSPERRAEMVERTGRGIGGSGGVQDGLVEEKIIKGSHQLPLEQVTETAGAVGTWIGKSVGRWKVDEARIAEGWERQSLSERLQGMSAWIPQLGKLSEGELARGSKSKL